jgi:hypothetical protein
VAAIRVRNDIISQQIDTTSGVLARRGLSLS